MQRQHVADTQVVKLPQRVRNILNIAIEISQSVVTRTGTRACTLLFLPAYQSVHRKVWTLECQ